MTKEILIDPAAAREGGRIEAPEIPVNRYQSEPQAEAEAYGAENLVGMYRDMVYIREFETMLDHVKTQGEYEGVSCGYGGPAHLSIGQEAVAVGQSYHLGVEDMIFGSHRSHGEVLAKSFQAIEELDERALMGILESYNQGETLAVVEGFAEAEDLRELATDYVFYGVLAEILGRKTGFNRGLGGSMHVFFPPFGVMPNNAIVGGSADIATGAALFKRVNREAGICIANIGDASVACGPVWEAMIFAAMDQYRTLWEDSLGGNPPILFSFINNFYGMGGQPEGETMGFGKLARVAMGVNPEAMHAERVDGFNPLAVADAIKRKREILVAGKGPVLLDLITYRFVGHSPSDASAYRERREIELWREHDALEAFKEYLIKHGHATEDQLAACGEGVKPRLRKVLQAATSQGTSPQFPLGSERIGELMFSNGVEASLAPGDPEVLIPIEESRLRVTQGKHRFGLDAAGARRSGREALTYAEALFEAMIHRYYQDASMIAYGQENRDWGGAFSVYRGLTECLPYHRLFNAPISEAAIVGTGVGYALSGGRAVVELMYCDFMGRAGDEIFNQMAKWQAMSGGNLHLPLVLRVSVGRKYGAQHSQDWTSFVAHIPGLKAMFPATPYDAKGMLNLALRGTDPVVFFESQRLYTRPETVVEGGVPLEFYEVEMGEPALRREGSDLTLVTIGATLYEALEAAEDLEAHGLSAEVIDARFINPLNYRPIVNSVRKTGRVLLASDACERGSFLHTMASNITQLAFDYLDAPAVVVGARNWITPPANMEALFFPSKDWIIDAVHERIYPLPGHEPSTRQATGEILRRNGEGV